jgi:hypothetical protein
MPLFEIEGYPFPMKVAEQRWFFSLIYQVFGEYNYGAVVTETVREVQRRGTVLGALTVSPTELGSFNKKTSFGSKTYKELSE